MRQSPYAPKRAQIFVCVNRRDEADPLGAGCSSRGEAVYEALRAELSARGERAEVWIARTHCLGICPKVGACVAISEKRGLFTEVSPSDIPELLSRISK